MPFPWFKIKLPDFFNDPKLDLEEKGLKTELDILGEGFPDQKQSDYIKTTFGVPYKGKIRPITAAQIYAQMPVLMACVDKICNYAMQVPLCLYKAKSLQDDVFDEKLVTSDPLAVMFDYINETITQADFISTLVFYLNVFGNAYVVMEPAPDAYKNICPFFLYVMNPVFCSVVPDADGEDLYLYQRAGKRVFYKKEFVIHIKENNPFDDFQGYVKLNGLDYDFSKERFAKGDLSRYFQSAVNVSGTVTLGMNQEKNDDEIRKIRRQLEQDYSGPANAYRTLILKNDQKYERVETTGTAQKAALDVIADSGNTTSWLFGVPIPLFTGDTRDIEKVEEMFWNSTIKPQLTRIEAQLTKFIRTFTKNYKWSLRFNYANISALKRQDFTVMRSIVAAMNTGYNTPNELRIANGLPPFAGEFSEFGDTPQPVYNLRYGLPSPALPTKGKSVATLSSMGPTSAKGPGGNPASKNGATPSLNVNGSKGGRDQSSGGEARMADESGAKSFDETEEEYVERIFEDDIDLVNAVNKILYADANGL